MPARQLFSRDTARFLAQALGWARCAVGVVALVAPEPLSRPWVGPDIEGGTRKVLARALGGRDLALGLGVVMAARRNAPVRGWVEAGALSDSVDTLATVIGFGRLPRWGRWGVLLSAGGAAVSAALLAPSLGEA
jgi:hypothetical protein